jgi:hypothetical protein
MDLDLGASPSEIEIRKGSTSVDSKGTLGGSLDVTGTFKPGTKSGQVTLRLVDFNQNGLGPFLEPLLADKKLVSVDINGSASAQFSPQGDSAMKADLQIGHLVVSDPKGQLPSTPLEVKLLLDAVVQKSVTKLQQLQLTLTPTTRARNQVELTGQVDMSNTNAIQGNIKLEADSLDVTPYYDLFAGGNKTPAKGAASGKAQPEAEATPGGPEREPDAMQLPLRNSVCEVNVGRFYLREVEVTNLQAVLKLDRSRVTLNPCRLALNGAAVSAGADVDLSVPGYKYNCNLNAQPIPLAPLVNSFAPDRKGEIAGTLVAQARFSGAGFTGASLQKNLSGQFDVSSTNLNLSVINLRSPVLKTLIGVVAFVPELVHNPESALGSFFQGVTGQGRGGLADDLNRSPINAITARGSIGDGKVDLQTASVQSPAFRADATGEITLAPVLTNSAIRIPIGLSLSRPIADRLGFTPSGAPATLSYVKLPDFYIEQGTIGKPESKIDKLALAGAAFKGVVGALPVVGGTAGSVLKGVEGVLTGRAADGSNTAGTANTNQPATNKAPLNNLLNRFLNPGGK